MKPSFPPEWKPLLDELGSAAAIARAIGMEPSSFSRAARGLAPFPAEAASSLEVLCDTYDMDVPKVRRRNTDLVPLSLLGATIQSGLPVSERELRELKDAYPEEQLVQLAESDGTPEKILIAVTRLLDID